MIPAQIALTCILQTSFFWLERKYDYQSVLWRSKSWNCFNVAVNQNHMTFSTPKIYFSIIYFFVWNVKLTTIGGHFTFMMIFHRDGSSLAFPCCFLSSYSLLRTSFLIWSSNISRKYKLEIIGQVVTVWQNGQ